jgi:YbbR domain-containing protein
MISHVRFTFAHLFGARALLLITLLIPGISFNLSSQTSTGEISIRVTDSSGALVPGAQIQISGADSGNLARTVVSNESGVAAVTFLQPGRYNISVAASGFETVNQQGLVVRVGETINLAVTLKPGQASESVTVTGESPLIEQKSSSLAQVTE